PGPVGADAQARLRQLPSDRLARQGGGLAVRMALQRHRAGTLAGMLVSGAQFPHRTQHRVHLVEYVVELPHELCPHLIIVNKGMLIASQ
ncbi:MAG: hypothetical protein ACRDN0_04980, partial [Trebonia sp.]